MNVSVLTWNLFHGRSQPEAGRDLYPEFERALSSWAWDVALLQEVPPWWPLPLAQALGASMRMCLTSRNEPYLPRKLVAQRWPDVIKSNGGGANAILVRAGGERIDQHRELRLRWRPERRWMHAVRLAPSGLWLANIHAEKQPRPQPVRDIARSANALAAWSDGAPIVFGGDFNIRDPLIGGLDRVASHNVDHVFVRGLRLRDKHALDPRPLSDHRPVVAQLGD
jgi:endonuclease/exonuclease/phosphatase family metal-dependent hydrolase